MLKTLKKYGFASMVEVIVTSIIFMLAAIGIFATITSLRPQAMKSSKRLEAAYAGKAMIESLRSSIDARTWETNESLLAVGINRTETINGFNVTWWLENVEGLNMRRLQMIINYDE
ncbi:MAG: hypothetical protein HQL24_10315 [Candidatus Omnitrophica bacterium]|nr:hypothetical protein [Candidatus Omnitrophota bacterium]